MQEILTAIRLLEQGGAAIGAVAAKVGYDDPAAFAKAFREMASMAPLDYRSRRMPA